MSMLCGLRLSIENKIKADGLDSMKVKGESEVVLQTRVDRFGALRRNL